MLLLSLQREITPRTAFMYTNPAFSHYTYTGTQTQVTSLQTTTKKHAHMHTHTNTMHTQNKIRAMLIHYKYPHPLRCALKHSQGMALTLHSL